MKSRKCLFVMTLMVVISPLGNAATISPHAGVSQSQQISPRLTIPYGSARGVHQPHGSDSSSRHGDRVERKRFGDERRGRGWYHSVRNKFWLPDFSWPQTIAITTFFADLVPQLDLYDIPEADFQKLLSEIRQFQDLLSGHPADADLTQALRHRLVEVIGKLVELAPRVNVQSLFEGPRPT